MMTLAQGSIEWLQDGGRPETLSGNLEQTTDVVSHTLETPKSNGDMPRESDDIGLDNESPARRA